MQTDTAVAGDACLQAMRDFCGLDESNTARLSALVQLAARLCDTPMAAISFNDHSRERFVSCFGFSLETIPAAKGFSDYIITGGAPLLLNDTRTDARFRNAPLMQSEVAPRFFAGVPIVNEGVSVGVLSVMDRVVRHLPPEKIDGLQVLAAQVSLLLAPSSTTAENSDTISHKMMKNIFSVIPGRHAMFLPEDLIVIAASSDVANGLATDGSEIFGKPLKDLLYSKAADSLLREEADSILDSIQRVVITGEANVQVAMRYSPVGANAGEERYWNIVNAPLKDSRGRLAYILRTSEDVTEMMELRACAGKASRNKELLERRAANLEADILRRSQEVERLNEHLRMAQSVARVGSYEIAQDGSSYFFSQEVFAILGIEKSNQAKDVVLAATAVEAQAMLKAKRDAAFTRRTTLDVTHPIIRPDGSKRYVWQQARAVQDKDGKRLKLHGTIQDVTHQKKLEDELNARVRQQRAVAQLGQLALRGTPLQQMWDRSVTAVAETLDVELCKVLELLPGGKEVKLVAGVGWKEGLVGNACVSTDRDSQAGYTLLSKDAVIVHDLRSEMRFDGPQLLHDHGVVSGISVIIAGNDGPWGVLGAHTSQRRQFTQDDVNFFESVANIIAEAVRHETTERRSAQRDLRQREISEFSLAVLRGETRDTLLNKATQIVADVLDIEFSSIGKRLDQNHIEIIAGQGWKPGVVGRATLAGGRRSHAGYVLENGPACSSAVETESSFRPSPLLLEHGIVSCIGVPIRLGVDGWGTLCGYSTRRITFAQEDVAFMQSMANVLAVIVEETREEISGGK